MKDNIQVTSTSHVLHLDSKRERINQSDIVCHPHSLKPHWNIGSIEGTRIKLHWISKEVSLTCCKYSFPDLRDIYRISIQSHKANTRVTSLNYVQYIRLGIYSIIGYSSLSLIQVPSPPYNYRNLKPSSESTFQCDCDLLSKGNCQI